MLLESLYKKSLILRHTTKYKHPPLCSSIYSNTCSMWLWAWVLHIDINTFTSSNINCMCVVMVSMSHLILLYRMVQRLSVLSAIKTGVHVCVCVCMRVRVYGCACVCAHACVWLSMYFFRLGNISNQLRSLKNRHRRGITKKKKENKPHGPHCTTEGSFGNRNWRESTRMETLSVEILCGQYQQWCILCNTKFW